MNKTLSAAALVAGFFLAFSTGSAPAQEPAAGGAAQEKQEAKKVKNKDVKKGMKTMAQQIMPMMEGVLLANFDKAAKGGEEIQKVLGGLGKLPAAKEFSPEFGSLAQDLGSHAGQLSQAAQAKNRDELHQHFYRLIDTCVKCHQQFRETR